MNGEVVFNSELFAPRIGCITCIITFLNMKEKNSCANMYVWHMFCIQSTCNKWRQRFLARFLPTNSTRWEPKPLSYEPLNKAATTASLAKVLKIVVTQI